MILSTVMGAILAGQAAGGNITVSAVQMRTNCTLEENTKKICRYIQDLAAAETQVVVFPECAITGYEGLDFRAMDPGPVVKAQKTVAEACKKAQVWAIVGTPDWQGEKLYNTALVIDDKGRTVERYNKVFLAEKWPDPGDHIAVFDVAGIRCGLIICHDERYPELVRLQAMKDARIIFYISHESGLSKPDKIGPYRAQIQARAVENSVWVVQSNAPANKDNSGSNGHSRIIQPDGNILVEASIYDEQVVTASIDPEKATGGLARKSLSCEFLREFWEEGLKVVEER